jgi:hypothetical protein
VRTNIRVAAVLAGTTLGMGLLAGTASAQGTAVGGTGDQYFLNDSFSGQANTVFAYGERGDEVFVGDWDGNGTDTLMIRRGGTFYVRNSNSSGAADSVFAYGNPGDTVLVGDWDGNGTDTLAVRRGFTYFVKNSTTTGTADAVFGYGDPGDTVLVGDWDGNRTDTLVVRRGGEYFVKNDLNTGRAERTFLYGDPGDTVLVGRWSREQGGDTLGVRRGGTYFLRNSLTSGPADAVFGYGNPTDVAFTGDWNGDGIDTLGVRRPAATGAAANQLSFGQIYAGPGYRYTISPLSSFTPSRTASPSGVQRAVQMTVTVENTGSATISPFDFYDTVTINGAEADQIYDSASGVGGAPYADILPGRSATWSMAVAVPPSGGELIVQVRILRNTIYFLGRV